MMNYLMRKFLHFRDCFGVFNRKIVGKIKQENKQENSGYIINENKSFLITISNRQSELMALQTGSVQRKMIRGFDADVVCA